MALYGITSEGQIIDTAGIEAAVNQIKAAADDFTECGRKIRDAKSYMGGDALSIDGKTLEPSYQEIKKGIDDFKSSIYEFADSILNRARQIETAQRQELQDYRNKQNQNN